MATKLNTKTAAPQNTAAPTQSAAPHSKTKVADGIEQGFFASAYANARARYIMLMTADEPVSAKRVLIAFIIGFVVSCAIMYFAVPYIIMLMEMAELFTGFGFVGFLVGVLGLIFTWWASAKVGNVVCDIINAKLVERGAMKFGHMVRNAFTREPKLA